MFVMESRMLRQWRCYVFPQQMVASMNLEDSMVSLSLVVLTETVAVRRSCWNPIFIKTLGCAEVGQTQQLIPHFETHPDAKAGVVLPTFVEICGGELSTKYHFLAGLFRVWFGIFAPYLQPEGACYRSYSHHGECTWNFCAACIW